MNQDQVTREWNAMAGDWDDMARPYAQSFYATLQQASLLPVDEGNSIILDFGCGTGLLTETLRTKCQTILAIDASPSMIELLQEKIQSRDWNNVLAIQGVFGGPTNLVIESLNAQYTGRIDLIVASNVLNFIPESDRPRTLQLLAQLLKPSTGRFCHSDWLQSKDEHPNGMTLEKATLMYHTAGMDLVSTESFDFGSGNVDVFFGVACVEDNERRLIN
ncbi:hypothetical protein MPSEU_001074600 [Mayamaea pseudoterrestris]|nr:hypothetical protein MPSEU_001074300 [Mayamaea pseudoterrestris]GKZ01235.1 hypothetical protein MPSEU_001074600 [Mayamaea pseudoterrestris]